MKTVVNDGVFMPLLKKTVVLCYSGKEVNKMEIITVKPEQENIVVKNSQVATDNNIRRTCPD